MHTQIVFFFYRFLAWRTSTTVRVTLRARVDQNQYILRTASFTWPEESLSIDGLMESVKTHARWRETLIFFCNTENKNSMHGTIARGAESVRICKCQNLHLSEYESVRVIFVAQIWKCRNLKVSKYKCVRIWKCQNLKVSELLEIWKCQECPESESVRNSQNLKVS